MNQRNPIACGAGIIGLLVVCWTGGGCAPAKHPPAEKTAYLLAVSLPQTAAATEAPYCFSVRTCGAAPAFATNSFVYRTGPVEYERDFYNRFLIPPADQITKTLSDWITAIQWAGCVPGTAPKDFYTVVPVIEEFYGDFRDKNNASAVVKMQIALTFTDSTCKCVHTLLSRSYEAKVPLPSAKAADLVGAFSECIGQILSEFQRDAEEVLGPKS
jgi:cholesterol transport system auxiliary component